MGAWIELKPEGAGPIRAWRADPAGQPRGGVVVIQEIFGVNAHIREVTDRFAAEGYLAIAPAIFEHVEKGFDVGYDADSRARGMAVVGQDRSRADAARRRRGDRSREGGRQGRRSSAFASAGRSPGRRRRACRA